MKSVRPNLSTALTPTLRKWLIVSLALAAFMIGNSIYLVLSGAADSTIPPLFQLMIFSHTVVGLLLALLLIIFVVAHLPQVWKRYHLASAVSGITLVTIGVTLTVTGLFILTDAASRDNRWAWWMHVVAAVAIPVAYFAHRFVSFVRPHRSALNRFLVAAAGAAVILGVGHGLTANGSDGIHTDFERYVGYAGEFVPAGYISPSSPFFPSAARTRSGGLTDPSDLLGPRPPSARAIREETAALGFNSEFLIGAESCERCHRDVVAQWEVSAHRFASFNNPFYEATINSMREEEVRSNRWVEEHFAELGLDTSVTVGQIKSQFCAGCHDPTLLFTGQMESPVDRTSLEAQAGITCLSCHNITAVDRTGNGSYVIGDDREDPYIFSSENPGTIGEFVHDAVLRSKPAAHKLFFQPTFFQTSEFCATCHKVSLPEWLNNYRWLRGQDEFDNWDDSGVSHNASRTAYLPPQRRICQDCHMPREPVLLGDLAAENGTVRSHRFLAVNTALPFIRGDTATLRRIESFLQDEKLSVDIFALKVAGQRDHATALDVTRPSLAAGSSITVDVVVRNRGVGHTFPGGTVDSNEGWLEFTLLDEAGDTIAVSGYIGDDGHLDEMAHVFKAVLVDRNGVQIQRRNAQDIFTAVFVNVIGPGSSDIAHYRFEVPRDLAGQNITIEARLLWRKFDRAYTEFAYNSNREGFSRFAHIPDLPVTEITSDQMTLAVVSAPSADRPPAATVDASQWERYNDYGLGLLAEGDTRGATAAFETVISLRPDFIEGHLNVARAALRDGNLNSAYLHLRNVETIEPENPRAAWVWGRVLQEDGRYTQAIAAYRRVLASFPGDRAAWRNLGRSYYLNQQYEAALAALDTVLTIDPEDRVSHYHQMLSYRALGREEEGAVSEQAYEYYRLDETAQEVTREFLSRNPGANLMAQDVRIHTLETR